MNRFIVSDKPTVVVFQKTSGVMDGSPMSQGSVTKNDKGQTVYEFAEGAQLPWGEPLEVLRMYPIGGDLEIQTEMPDGTSITLRTVTAGSADTTPLYLAGAEKVKLVGPEKVMFLVRRVRSQRS